jgi:hypothetical protein
MKSAGLGILFVLLAIVLFSSSGRDDSHITFWPAYTLLTSGELLNYNGERVEQSSSLLFVLLLAAVAYVTSADLPALAGVMALLFGGLNVLAIYRLSERVEARTGLAAAALAATSAYPMYWSVSGMETSLAGLLTTLTVLSLGGAVSESGVRRVHVVGLTTCSCCLYLLSRPEAPIVLVCVAAGSNGLLGLRGLASSDEAVRTRLRSMLVRSLGVTGIVLLGVAVLALWRHLYFGSLLPQPVTAKAVGISIDSITSGVGYVASNTLSDVLASVIFAGMAAGVGRAIWLLLARQTIDSYVMYATLFVVTYGAFIVSSGGDWMEGGRFIAHIQPLGLVFIPYVARGMLPRRWSSMGMLAGFLVAFQLAFLVRFARAQSTGMPIWAGIEYFRNPWPSIREQEYSWFERTNRIHSRDIPVVEHLDRTITLLSNNGDRSVSVLSQQMGMAAFYVSRRHQGRVRLLDRRGLVERSFTSCPLSAALPRWQIGLALEYEFFFSHETEFEACGITRPDVIFDIFIEELGIQRFLEINGYAITYVQRGLLATGSALLPGRRVSADQFIAVRRELVPWLENAADMQLVYNRP